MAKVFSYIIRSLVFCAVVINADSDSDYEDDFIGAPQCNVRAVVKISTWQMLSTGRDILNQLNEAMQMASFQNLGVARRRKFAQEYRLLRNSHSDVLWYLRLDSIPETDPWPTFVIENDDPQGFPRRPKRFIGGLIIMYAQLEALAVTSANKRETEIKRVDATLLENSNNIKAVSSQLVSLKTAMAEEKKARDFTEGVDELIEAAIEIRKRLYNLPRFIQHAKKTGKGSAMFADPDLWTECRKIVPSQLHWTPEADGADVTWYTNHTVLVDIPTSCELAKRYENKKHPQVVSIYIPKVKPEEKPEEEAEHAEAAPKEHVERQETELTATPAQIPIIVGICLLVVIALLCLVICGLLCYICRKQHRQVTVV